MKKTIYALSLLMSLLIAPNFAAAAESSNSIIDNNTRSQNTRLLICYRCYIINLYSTTNNRFAVTPSYVTMQAGTEYTFDTTGGVGGLQWSALTGSLSATSGTEVTYTAAATAGNDTITITDGRGRSARIQVQVTSSIGTLSITPLNVNLNPGEKQLFTVNNAHDRIKWSANGGSFIEYYTQAEYTAPDSSGTYTIVGTDYKTGRTVEATVTVARKLTVTPTEAQIGAATSQTFSVQGGEEPYTWQVLGKGSLDIDSGNTVEYTAAKTTGEDSLVVMDNKGASAEVAITVNSTLLITPENAVLAPNGTKIFSVSGGVGQVSYSRYYNTIW
jgi:hypothetical protein